MAPKRKFLINQETLDTLETLISDGWTQAEIARSFGVSQATIGRVIREYFELRRKGAAIETVAPATQPHKS